VRGDSGQGQLADHRRQETSKEKKLREAHDTVSWLNPRRRGRASRGVSNPWRGGPVFRDRLEPHEGPGVRDGVRRRVRMKASKGEPQERDRDGTSPAGRVGSKASRG
jgi:hypothetical protein